MNWTERLGIRHVAPPPAPKVQEYVWREGYVDVAAKDFPDGEIKGAVMGISDSFANLLALGDPHSLSSVQAQFNVYKQSSAVSVPINLIAENLGKITPILQNRETDETERKHEVLDRLRRPHPMFPQARFFETLGKYFLIAAEAPIVALGAETKGPVQIQPVNPKTMSPVADMQTGLPKSWHITGQTLTGVYTAKPRDFGSQFRNGADRVLKTIIGFSTDDDSVMRGQSKLVSAARDVWQSIEGAKYNINLLRQGGRASLVFHFKNSMKRPEFLETRDLILDQVEGADNAGRVLVTKGGEMDVKDLSANNRDMEFQEGQKGAREVLAQVFKVPIVLTSTDAATFNNYENAILTLWDDAVIPLATTLLEAMSIWLFPRYGLDPDVWRLYFDEEKIEVLRARKLKERSERAKSGLESINEIRKSMPGAEPADGGDEILVSGTLQPLSAVAQGVEDVTLPATPTSGPSPTDPEDDPPKPEDDPDGDA